MWGLGLNTFSSGTLHLQQLFWRPDGKMVKTTPGLCTGRCHNLPTVEAQVPSGQPWSLAQCSRRQSPGQ